MRRSDPFECILWLIIATAIFVIYLGLAGCATTTQNHRDLSTQLIFFRDSNTGLGTNRICAEKDIIGRCKSWSTKSYDLNDAEVRKILIRLGFSCKIGGKRFKIDPDNPGFARYKEKSCLFCSKTEIVERIPITESRYIVDAGTYCYTEAEHPGGLIDLDL